SFPSPSNSTSLIVKQSSKHALTFSTPMEKPLALSKEEKEAKQKEILSGLVETNVFDDFEKMTQVSHNASNIEEAIVMMLQN
ncbi:hypothetical protein PFISCL1PPCAC_1603, partial [Pristionchus fissidentatus]